MAVQQVCHVPNSTISTNTATRTLLQQQAALLNTIRFSISIFPQLPQFTSRQLLSAQPRFLLLRSKRTMADQYQQTKDTSTYKTEEAKEHTGTGNLGQTAHDKAGQVGQAGQEKWDQTKQGASDATGTTQRKAEEAKEQTGNILHQTGDKVKDVVGKLSGDNQ